jgi:hypothetical protein
MALWNTHIFSEREREGPILIHINRKCMQKEVKEESTPSSPKKGQQTSQRERRDMVKRDVVRQPIGREEEGVAPPSFQL